MSPVPDRDRPWPPEEGQQEDRPLAEPGVSLYSRHLLPSTPTTNVSFYSFPRGTAAISLLAQGKEYNRLPYTEVNMADPGLLGAPPKGQVLILIIFSIKVAKNVCSFLQLTKHCLRSYVPMRGGRAGIIRFAYRWLTEGQRNR